ncbi:Iron-sulfur assembly protein 1, partial [Coemansia sp. Cherry 401B]
MSSRVMVRMAPALKGRRSPLTLTQAAVRRLKELKATSQPEDRTKTLKIGIQGKGCSGNAYTLSWVDAPKKFDEKVSQD